MKKNKTKKNGTKRKSEVKNIGMKMKKLLKKMIFVLL
jgi:hypothetical protein